jgi:hypothetical protein
LKATGSRIRKKPEIPKPSSDDFEVGPELLIILLSRFLSILGWDFFLNPE